MVFTGVERMGGQNRIQPNILYVGKLSEPQCRVFLENYRDVSAVVIRDSGGGYSPSMTRRSNIMELGRSGYARGGDRPHLPGVGGGGTGGRLHAQLSWAHLGGGESL